jgi:disulfide bond formation protein DsbB
MMQRKTTILLLLAAFLATTTGAVSLLHHHDHESHGCQTCLLIKMAGLAMVSVFLLLTLLERQRRTQHATVIRVLRSHHFTSAVPRAPPRG